MLRLHEKGSTSELRKQVVNTPSKTFSLPSKFGNMAAGAFTASQNTYNEFAKVLGLAQQNNERPEVHVAPDGLASQFVYICSSLSVT